ncbi:MAG: hypothetical protein IPP48_14540 [Chitinophagaceae bacterium]|nr:hypothetical protein [Chitinophagaceae bacterium]
MIKKKILYLMVLFFAVCFYSNLHAQTFDVKWGEQNSIKNDFDDAIPIDNGKMIVHKTIFKAGFMSAKPPKNFLTIVDKDMEPIVEYELEVEEKNAYMKGFEKYGKNIYFLYNAYDKETKTTSFYALKIDPKNAQPTSKIILGTYESDNRDDQAEVSYKLSSDSSKVLIFVEGPERKKENKKFYIGVFDTDLKKIWNKEIELPILEKFVSLYDEDITNDGKVYVAIKHYDKEVTRQTVREDGNKVPSYVYKLLAYSSTNSTGKEINFNLNNNFIQGTKLIYDKNNTITVAGLYKRKHNGNLNGVFYATIDPITNEVKNPKMADFDAEILRLVDKDNFGTDKDSDPGLYSNFRINFILNRNNGSVDLVSEFYELRIVTTYDQKYGSRTTYYYKYGDIVNTNIDKTGKATFTRIPKNQKFVNSNIFLGYYAFVYNDKLILLYNDDKDNVDRDLEKKPDDVMKFKKSVFVAATINTKGSLSRQAIFSNDDEDYITIPRNTTRVNDKKFLITSDLLKLFKKRTRFGTLEIK